MKAKVINAKRSTLIQINFRIPKTLATILKSTELNQDQKINLVKSYSDEVADENGDKMEQISVQYAVCLIMALELNAL